MRCKPPTIPPSAPPARGSPTRSTVSNARPHGCSKDPQSEAALAGATPYLRLFAHAAGGALLAEQALAAARMASDGSAPARIALARFFAEHLAVAAGGLERSVTEGAASVNAANAALVVQF